MGRYSQARRRGGGSLAAAVLPAPPAPGLSAHYEEVWQYTAAAPNEGGTVQLWQSADGVGGWIMYGSAAWETEKLWGSVAEFTGSYLRARDVGNGVTWAGNGAWSDVLGPL
jgi:hypothetical protein